MFADVFAEPVSAPSAPSSTPHVARALSARELLSKLEGAERDELQRAMKARDLEAVRAMIAKHGEGARIEREGYVAALEAQAGAAAAPAAEAAAPAADAAAAVKDEDATQSGGDKVRP